MKNAPLIISVLPLFFLLAACASNTTPTNGFNFGNGGGTPRTLNPESKLALGTVKLEGTKLAVDSKMAATLIPLWQMLIQLNSSSSTAPQEITAVIDQIHTTMTPDQINAINSMQLTQTDIFTVFQGQGQANGTGGTGLGSTAATGSTRSSNSSGGNRGNRGNAGGQNFVFVGGGGPPAGAFPGGGFENGGGPSSASGTQTNSAQTSAQAAEARQKATSTLVINQLIKLLETKLRT